MKSLPEGINENEFIEILKEISWEVSDLLNSYEQGLDNPDDFKKNLKIQNKESGPVTAADLAVNIFLKKQITKYFKNVNWEFLSEEDQGEINLTYPWVWIIDPLDGTKDFINRTGEFAVHLALTYEKVPVFSIVIIPSKELLWIFKKDIGSWSECRSGNIKKTSNLIERSKNKLRIVTSRSHMPNDFIQLLKSTFNTEITSMGSVGYKISSLLSGDNDIYISYSSTKTSCPKDWDFAAPCSVLRGFGGSMTDLQGRELKFLKDNKYKQEGIIIASINLNHNDLCRKILMRLS